MSEFGSDSGSVVYHYTPTFYEVEGENIDSVVITSGGDLIESCGKKIICSCKLCPASTTFITLRPFYTYEPDYKYYIVQIRDQLFIVKKINKNELQVQRTLNRVSHFSIDDEINAGQPQISVWTIGERVPSVLNLYSNFTNEGNSGSPKFAGKALIKINTQAQVMASCLRTAKNVLADKRILVSKMSLSHTYSVLNAQTSQYELPLVGVLGEKAKERPSTKSIPVSLGKPWVKIYSNTVIVGLFISNLQESEMKALDFTVLTNSTFFEKTVVYKTSKGFDFSGEISDFIPCDFLPSLSHGYVLGVLKEPVLSQKTLTLELILSFTLGDYRQTVQYYVGDVLIALEDLLSSTHVPFKEEKEVPDLLAVIVVCENTDIVFKCVDDIYVPNLKSVLTQIGYIELSNQFFVHDFSKDIPPCVAMLQTDFDEGFCCLRIYYRRISQLFLLVVALKNKIGSNLDMERRTAEASRIVSTTLYEEVNALHDFFSSKSSDSYVSCENNLTVDAHQLSGILSSEVRTEMNFPLLRSFLLYP